MNHQQAENLLTAYIDKELSLSETSDFERHLNSCAQCQQAHQEQMQISQLVKHNTYYFEAKPELTKRIEILLSNDSFKPLSPKSARPFWQFNWLTLGSKGTAMASLAALVLSGSLFLATPSTQEKMTYELIASHIRSLEVDHLSDVISTDKHTVKPWFNGKLDFAPPVVDLVSAGYALEGGRLDYVDGRTVAVLIYRHKKHPINLYVWPNSHIDVEIKNTSLNGYNVTHWNSRNMNYWAVSDLESSKLTEFSKKLEVEISSPEKS